MKKYINKFESIVKEVESNPYLEVTEFKVNPPLSKQELADIEAAVGIKIDKSILNFYQQMNGLILNWQIKPDLAKDEQAFTKIRKQYDDYYLKWPEDEIETVPFAKINLLSLEDCFIKKDWQEIIVPQPNEIIEFADISCKHSDFVKKLKPFDLFSDYDCMAYILDNKSGDFKILLLSDYYIAWDESRITNFESYIEMLLTTRGIVESRSRIYKEYAGHQKPLLLTAEDYWKEHQEYVPKLFQ
jgi:hypothetical protein